MEVGETTQQIIEVFEYFGSLIYSKNPFLGLLIIIGFIFVFRLVWVRYRNPLRYKLKKRKLERRLVPIYR